MASNSKSNEEPIPVSLDDWAAEPVAVDAWVVDTDSSIQLEDLPKDEDPSESLDDDQLFSGESESADDWGATPVEVDEWEASATPVDDWVTSDEDKEKPLDEPVPVELDSSDDWGSVVEVDLDDGKTSNLVDADSGIDLVTETESSEEDVTLEELDLEETPEVELKSDDLDLGETVGQDDGQDLADDAEAEGLDEGIDLDLTEESSAPESHEIETTQEELGLATDDPSLTEAESEPSDVLELDDDDLTIETSSEPETLSEPVGSESVASERVDLDLDDDDLLLEPSSNSGDSVALASGSDDMKVESQMVALEDEDQTPVVLKEEDLKEVQSAPDVEQGESNEIGLKEEQMWEEDIPTAVHVPEQTHATVLEDDLGDDDGLVRDQPSQDIDELSLGEDLVDLDVDDLDLPGSESHVEIGAVTEETTPSLESSLFADDNSEDEASVDEVADSSVGVVPELMMSEMEDEPSVATQWETVSTAAPLVLRQSDLASSHRLPEPDHTEPQVVKLGEHDLAENHRVVIDLESSFFDEHQISRDENGVILLQASDLVDPSLAHKGRPSASLKRARAKSPRVQKTSRLDEKFIIKACLILIPLLLIGSGLAFHFKYAWVTVSDDRYEDIKSESDGIGWWTEKAFKYRTENGSMRWFGRRYINAPSYEKVSEQSIAPWLFYSNSGSRNAGDQLDLD